MTLTRQQAVAAILNSNQWVGVTFVSRETGQERHMVVRMNVKKYLKGGEQSYDPALKNLIWGVWESPSTRREKKEGDRGYRMIPYEGITKLRINGKEEEVK